MAILGGLTDLYIVIGLSAGIAAGSRGLQQSNGPGAVYGRPASATIGDLANDPQGRQHLLARLGNPVEYTGHYPLYVGPGQYNVDPKADPSVLTPIENGPPVAQGGSWKVVGNSGAVAIHALPFTNEIVLLLSRPTNYAGGGDASLTGFLTVANGTQSEVAAIYNLTSNTYTPFHIAEAPQSSGHVLLPDGRGLIVGGALINLNGDFLTAGFQAIRVFDPVFQNYSVVGQLDRARFDPTLVTLGDGNVLVLGGTQQEAMGYAADPGPTSTKHGPPTCSPNLGGSPADPYYDNPSYSILDSGNFSQSPSLTLTILLEAWPINSYPYAVQLPAGSVLVVAGAQMEALYFSASGATTDNTIGALPKLPVPLSHPQNGGFTLLPLEGPNYTAQVLLAGGAGEVCSGVNTPASNKSYLVNVTPGANHSIVEEEMAFPRVLGDLTLLPDGTAFLCNGAQIGIGGGAGPNHALQANGTTIGEIYNVSQPVGQRWSTVADSQIWRLYHSVAFLTSNAEVLVSGSETTGEHRVQIWTPGYLQNGKPRPVISTAPATLTYTQNATVEFTGVPLVDRVVLQRLVGATDTSHMDQRQIVLTGASQAGSVQIQAPPDSNVAPPGQYMLFVLYQGVPSKAQYVSLQLPAAAVSGIITS